MSGLPPKWHSDEFATRRIEEIRDRMPYHVIDAINDDVRWLLEEVERLRAERDKVKGSPSDDLGNPGKVEFGLLMSGGGYQIRSDSPEVERIYPIAEWAAYQIKTGAHVYRRRVVVVEEWEELR